MYDGRLPGSQACEAGKCVDKPVSDSDGGVDAGGGLNGPGSSPDGQADGGTLQSASLDDSSGCGCVVAGGASGEKAAIAGLALAIATAFRRRRPRR